MTTMSTLPVLNLADIDTDALNETLESVAGVDLPGYFAPENVELRIGSDVVDTIRFLRANPELAAALGIGALR